METVTCLLQLQNTGLFWELAAWWMMDMFQLMKWLLTLKKGALVSQGGIGTFVFRRRKKALQLCRELNPPLDF